MCWGWAPPQSKLTVTFRRADPWPSTGAGVSGPRAGDAVRGHDQPLDGGDQGEEDEAHEGQARHAAECGGRVESTDLHKEQVSQPGVAARELAHDGADD